MEKYYLGQIRSDSEVNYEYDKIKFVEVQTSQSTITFGAIILAHQQGNSLASCYCIDFFIFKSDSQPSQRRLELYKRINFETGKGRKVIDFDNLRCVRVVLNDLSCNCIILCSGGRLLSVNLVDGTVKCLLDNINQLPSSSNRHLVRDTFIKCKIHQQQPTTFSEVSDGYQIHLLTEKSYLSLEYEVSSRSWTIIHEYLMDKQELNSLDTKFVNMIPLNERLVILELANTHLRTINGSECLNQDFDPKLGWSRKNEIRHLFIREAITDTNFLISSSQTTLVAHSLRVAESREPLGVAIQTDPDQILEEEPPFEMDLCWSIDFNEIDSLHFFISEQLTKGNINISLCPIWRDVEHGCPSHLLIIYEYQLLLYSFEQQDTLPISSVYDSSFLECIPESGLNVFHSEKNNESVNSNHQKRESHLDFTLKPKLINNFELIGTRQVDALFNTIFLGQKIHLDETYFSCSLGIALSCSNLGHLIAFRLPYSNLMKDSVEHQNLIDALRSSTSLLELDIEKISKQNLKLKKLVESLESDSKNCDPQSESFKNYLSHSIEVNLERWQDIGAVYDLRISVSNLINLNQIIICSTVFSHFLKPSCEDLDPKSIECENYDMSSDKTKAILLTDFQSNPSISPPIKESSSFNLGSVKNKTIKSWLIITINSCEASDIQKSQGFKYASISVPTIVMDGQFGSLDVYISHSMSQFSPHSGVINQNLQPEQAVRFHKHTRQMKPQLSYEISDLVICDNSSQELTIEGSFDAQTMKVWLDTCLNSPSDRYSFKLKSAFSQCYIDVCISESKLKIRTDDFTAIDSIMRQILYLATNASVKLRVDRSTPKEADLRHLLMNQHRNIASVKSLDKSLKERVANGVRENMNLRRNLLYERLIAQVNFEELEDDFHLEESVREDIKITIDEEPRPNSSSLSSYKYQSRQDPEIGTEEVDSIQRTMKDIICGYIIDAIVDFDKLMGIKLPSDKSMLDMRFKVMALIEDSSGSARYFADEIIHQWTLLRDADT